MTKTLLIPEKRALLRHKSKEPCPVSTISTKNYSIKKKMEPQTNYRLQNL